MRSRPAKCLSGLVAGVRQHKVSGAAIRCSTAICHSGFQNCEGHRPIRIGWYKTTLQSPSRAARSCTCSSRSCVSNSAQYLTLHSPTVETLQGVGFEPTKGGARLIYSQVHLTALAPLRWQTDLIHRYQILSKSSSARSVAEPI